MILNKQMAVQLAIMVETGLVCYKHYYKWCDHLIMELTEVPEWIIELSVTKYSPDAVSIIRKYAYCEPFESFNQICLGDFGTACYYLRYQRQELSWASFLLECGQLVDGWDSFGCKEPCEYFFTMLNQLENQMYDKQLEKEQQEEFLAGYVDEVRQADELYRQFLPYFNCYIKEQCE